MAREDPVEPVQEGFTATQMFQLSRLLLFFGKDKLSTA